MEHAIRDYLVSHGAAVVGFADLRSLPADVREGYPFGVSMAVALDPRIIRGIDNGPTNEYFAEYTRVNALLNELSAGAAEVLTRAGRRAKGLAATMGGGVDRENLSTRLPHKTVATRAGLGWIGKTALLITERFGSAVRLGTVLTDAPLPAAAPIDESRCGECESCATACPAGASKRMPWRAGLERAEFYDVFACLAKAKELSAKIGLDHTICGICIQACPYTRRYLAGP